MRPDDLVTRGVLEELLANHLAHVRELVGTSKPVSPICTAAEAAELLGVCTKTLYAMIDRGELRAVRLGTGWRLRRADVLEYFDRLLETG
jgi:excisionase family DNA binding protein